MRQFLELAEVRSEFCKFLTKNVGIFRTERESSSDIPPKTMKVARLATAYKGLSREETST